MKQLNIHNILRKTYKFFNTTGNTYCIVKLPMLIHRQFPEQL